MRSVIVRIESIGLRELALIAITVFCVLCMIAAIGQEHRERQAARTGYGARAVDLAEVKRQIESGDLSKKKALFYRKGHR
jgi:hypothetical protein